ncbi:DNA-J related domain-containing protein [Neptunomonas qingdaonensis]|uniref:DnaJ domain-containing protein n=1 Tax=Neptunomonas qingdaonensis TaxID=1045558 RepID=A0A1I2TUH1_9GAMM|nr:DNA-J related domain-containing protein [Neptunomonas qingdaonensis]SFG65911.1 DnaJ domain-containing protein [Neptunomonas qingdaonensis]
MHNPITAIILASLKKHPAGFSEFTLIQAIEAAGLFDALDSQADVALFQKHFLTMNALYQLQITLWEEEVLYLSISALDIHLVPSSKEPYSKELHCEKKAPTLPEQSRNEALKSYYLDWSHYNEADEASVIRLLNSFWQRFLNPEQRQQALDILEIAEQAPDQATIRRQFRQLAAKHHPDKGGDSASFIAIREAYEVLQETDIS